MAIKYRVFAGVNMPFGSEGVEPGIGLALSGGGFRAALFHTGTFWRLIELGILPGLTRISSVSGGSIFSGVLACAWQRIVSSPSPLDAYTKFVVEPVRQFCTQQIDTFAIGEGLLGIFGTAAEHIETKYSQIMPLSLNELPDAPLFVFDSTNLQTGRNFRFSKAYMGDYRLGLIRNPTLPVARAVAASSAFPPFLSPVVLENPGVFEAVTGADLNTNPSYTQKIYLADGGVYDNLGLETVWERFETVLASDAGAPFALSASIQTDWIHQPLRALDVALDQALGLRKRVLIDEFQRNDRAGAYWGIATSIEAYQIADALPCDRNVVQPLALVRTRLDPFSDSEQSQLINWGYALCDAAVRKHAPQIALTNVAPKWPCIGYPLG
jgi:NTE family protein